MKTLLEAMSCLMVSPDSEVTELNRMNVLHIGEDVQDSPEVVHYCELLSADLVSELIALKECELPADEELDQANKLIVNSTLSSFVAGIRVGMEMERP